MANQGQTDSSSTLEKFIIIFLFVITVSLFSTWGYDAAVYILGQLFGVDIPDATYISFTEGIIAMIASVLIFMAGVFWWKHNPDAKPYFIGGSIGFLVKNVLDIANELIVFGEQNTDPTVTDIKALASNIGWEIFQAAFWIFILIYFLFRMKHVVSRSHADSNEHGQQTTLDEKQ